jgi:NADH dehydrogenase
MILLMGGTGLLGGQVLRRLREERYPVRLFTRGSRDWRHSSVHDLRQKGIEVIIANALDVERLYAAAEDCTAVINLVGSMPPQPGVDLHGLHITVVENILEVVKRRKIQRLIHVSCLGAGDESDGEYLTTKHDAEDLVRQTKLYWTIFRPSYIFGEKFPFLDVIMPLIKFRLFMPVVGSGQNNIQPVHVDNVAQAIVSSVYDKGTVAKTFDLAGPDQLSIQELMEVSRKSLGIPGLSMNIPSPTAAKAATGLSKLMPKSQLSTDVLQLLLSNSTTSENALEDYFNIKLIPLEPNLTKILAIH